MDYLFNNPAKIEELLHNKFILLMLDYDGTLTPITGVPHKAAIPQETRELLQKLSKNYNCKISIISGRSLKDIKNMVGIQDIIYAGNHGFEIEGPKIKFESQVPPKFKSAIRNIAKELSERLSGIKGIIVEDKVLSLSIHYRLAGEKDIPELEKTISEVTGSSDVRDKIKVNLGKKVYEIKPNLKWDKGKIALWLLARQQFVMGENEVLPVYIGDDVTDEDAFKALKKQGLTIFVGVPGDSKANYYLKNTEEVIRFLRLISQLKSSRPCKN